jgi:hypothetical protein
LPNILQRPFGSRSELCPEIDPVLRRLNLITGFIKLLLNPFMTNHSFNKSKQRLREWVHERLVGAAAFPLWVLPAYLDEGDIFTWALRGHNRLV